MPRVPDYQRSVDRITPDVSTPQILRPPEGAFGGNVAQSIKQAGDSMMALGEKIVARAQERQREISDKQILERDTEFRSHLQDILFNSESDEKGIPKGILQRNLGQASGATKDFDSKFNTMRKTYIGSFKDVRMQEALGKLIDSAYISSRDTVIKHERAQTDQDIENGFNNNIELKVNQAAQLPDGPTVITAIQGAVGIQKRLNEIKGYDENTSAAKTMEVTGKMAKSAFASAMDDNNLIKAQSIYNAVQGKIPAETEAKMKEAIDSGIPYNMAVRDAFLDPIGTRKKLETNSYEIKDPVKRKAAYDFTNTLAKNMISDNQEQRSNVILDGLAQGNLTLTDIENQMQVPEEAGGLKKSILVNYQKALQRGIEKDLNRMINEKDENKDPTARAQKVRDYIDLIDAFTSDDTDKWHAREKLSAAYADGIINGQEAQFLNKLKTDLKDIQFNRSTGPMVSAIKTVKGFLHRNNASDEEITLNVKRLLGTLKDGQAVPADTAKSIIQNHVINKIPDALTYTSKGQLMMDAYGNKAIVYPDGTIEPYMGPKETQKPAEKK